MTDYQTFLANKQLLVKPAGFDAGAINDQLFPFQHDITRWALKLGRAAIFSRYGTGKPPMQLEWAKHVTEHTGGNVLILAPLAVAQQTRLEGEKFGISVNVCRSQADVLPGINITNYEMLPHFEPDTFQGIVLDESSILKAYDGKNRTTTMQERWLHDLRGQGMACHVCYGWVEAARTIVRYLGKDTEEYGL